MKITRKLLLGYFIFVLLLWGVGLFAGYQSQRVLRERIGEDFETLASEILNKIDRDIYTKIELFQEYTRASILQKQVIASNQEFEQLDDIQAYISLTDEEWTSTATETLTPFMQELMQNELAEELQEKIKFYTQSYGYPVFSEVFVTNKYGANVAQTGKTSDYRQDDEEWWQKAKQDGLYVQGVDYDESADVYSVDFGIRIDDEDGNFIGVMKVVLNIEDALSIKETKTETQIETLRFRLIDNEGNLLYTTGKFEFLEDVSGEVLSRIREDTGYFIMQDESGGKEELFAYAHQKGYKDFKGLGWILIIEGETEEIFEPVYGLRNKILLISLGGTLLALFLSLFLANSITQPLLKLRDATLEISRGQLETRVDIASKDEFGELAAHFNQMVTNLQQGIIERERLQIERERLQIERESLQQEVIEAQRQAIQELSTPVIPVMDAPDGTGGIIVMPLIGSIDSMRARDVTRSLLAGISQHQAKVVILDVTGVGIVDTGVVNHLNKTIQAARLKGVHTIVTGISDVVAETIVDLGIDWSNVTTLADLQTGLTVALKSLGVKLSDL